MYSGNPSFEPRQASQACDQGQQSTLHWFISPSKSCLCLLLLVRLLGLLLDALSEKANPGVLSKETVATAVSMLADGTDPKEVEAAVYTMWIHAVHQFKGDKFSEVVAATNSCILTIIVIPVIA